MLMGNVMELLSLALPRSAEEYVENFISIKSENQTLYVFK